MLTPMELAFLKGLTLCWAGLLGLTTALLVWHTITDDHDDRA